MILGVKSETFWGEFNFCEDGLILGLKRKNVYFSCKFFLLGCKSFAFLLSQGKPNSMHFDFFPRTTTNVSH